VKVLESVDADCTHCACLNIGLGQDGSPLLSWSRLVALYQKTDGTLWAGVLAPVQSSNMRAPQPVAHLSPWSTCPWPKDLRFNICNGVLHRL
jgi:hypothetical protein